MSDFLERKYRDEQHDEYNATGDIILNVRIGRDQDYSNRSMLNDEALEMRERLRRGELNVKPPTYKSGNPRVLQQGTYVIAQEKSKGKRDPSTAGQIKTATGIIIGSDSYNIGRVGEQGITGLEDRVEVLQGKKIKTLDDGSEPIYQGSKQSIRRSKIVGIVSPAVPRKQSKPVKNKKTIPQQIQRSEFASGGALAKAKARDELKTGKKTEKGRVAVVLGDGKIARPRATKSYLSRNL